MLDFPTSDSLQRSISFSNAVAASALIIGILNLGLLAYNVDLTQEVEEHVDAILYANATI